MIQRNFKLALTAGRTIPLVIPASQYDSGEQWIFTLIDETGAKYTPESGAIIGIKSDKMAILNAGTVDAAGRVVINETEQMTAAVGKNVYEILINDQTHGSANFIVMVEPRPGDNADFSDSDLSLLQQAIDGTSETAIKAGVQEWMDDNLTSPTNPIVDASLSLAGAAADAKKTGDEISSLKSAIAQGSGLTNEAKTALLELLQHVAYADDDGQDYYDALESALNPPTNLSYITAVYTQSGTVYPSTSLNSLKSDLVVTAHYSDLTTSTVSSYTLSGSLTAGTSTITVTYSGKTTTFNVTVTAPSVTGWYYPFNGSLLSAGTKDVSWTGAENYIAGRVTGTQAYHHKVTTEGDSSTDQGTIKAVQLSEILDTSQNFTIAFWHSSFTNRKGHPIAFSEWYSDDQITNNSTTNMFSSFTSNTDESGWSCSVTGRATKKYAGITLWFYQNNLFMAIHNANVTCSAQITMVPPTEFDSTQWHHYAFTRSGTTARMFIDGVLVYTGTLRSGIYQPTQIGLGSLFYQNSAQKTDLQNMSNGDKISDLYMVQKCKWTENFDPTNIVYD